MPPKLGKALQRAIGKKGVNVPESSIVHTIERLCAENLDEFSSHAFALFESSFPNPDEREPVEEIKERILYYDSNGPNEDGSEFHAHVYLTKENQVVAYSQGSTMYCGPKAGLCYFWQYGCVADDSFVQQHYGVKLSMRNLGISKLMHWVNTSTLKHQAFKLRLPSLDCEVWESEQLGLGSNKQEVEYTATRLVIHCKSGAKVMLGVMKDGETFVNPYVQCRLTKDSDPIVLHLLLKWAGKVVVHEEDEELDMETARAIVLDGLVKNFRNEGFAKEDVDEVEAEMQSRLALCAKILLVRYDRLPNAFTLAETDKLFRAQLIKLYDCNTLEEAKEKYNEWEKT